MLTTLVLLCLLAGATPTAVDRVRDVLLSSDLVKSLCWDGADAELAYQQCCAVEEAQCFDAFFTRERCCRDSRDDSDFKARAMAMRQELLSCEANLARGVGRPRGLSQYAITAATQFGRIVWCAAKKVNVAFDVFAGEGGSAWLLADAIVGHSPEAGRGPGVVTFERHSDDVAGDLGKFSRLLETLSDFTPMVLEPADASQLVEALQETSASGDTAALERLGGQLAPLTVYHGLPYPSQPEIKDDLSSMQVASKFEPEPSPLEALCRALRPRLVVLDPTSAIVREWLVIEAACKPDIVFIFNTNLPNGAGWIREKLMLRGDWAEVLTGVILDPAVAGAGLVSEVLMPRRWSLLVRDTPLLAL
mmetsp:Transcript_98219/g.173981  ORF Transcript_98219/g.173981 Transcript_98219/m.173981 type:complete len:362 (-) Transcript_98219:73-1158(-)